VDLLRGLAPEGAGAASQVALGGVPEVLHLYNARGVGDTVDLLSEAHGRGRVDMKIKRTLD